MTSSVLDPGGIPMVTVKHSGKTTVYVGSTDKLLHKRGKIRLSGMPIEAGKNSSRGNLAGGDREQLITLEHQTNTVYSNKEWVSFYKYRRQRSLRGETLSQTNSGVNASWGMPALPLSWARLTATSGASSSSHPKRGSMVLLSPASRSVTGERNGSVPFAAIYPMMPSVSFDNLRRAPLHKATCDTLPSIDAPSTRKHRGNASHERPPPLE